jgi:hypothetical protein
MLQLLDLARENGALKLELIRIRRETASCNAMPYPRQKGEASRRRTSAGVPGDAGGTERGG